MKTDILLHGDSLELMKDIPDASIDAIICDLPYEVLHKNNPSVRWDRLIPFEPLWEQYLRVAKPEAPVISSSLPRNVHRTAHDVSAEVLEIQSYLGEGQMYWIP